MDPCPWKEGDVANPENVTLTPPPENATASLINSGGGNS